MSLRQGGLREAVDPMHVPKHLARNPGGPELVYREYFHAHPGSTITITATPKAGRTVVGLHMGLQWLTRTHTAQVYMGSGLMGIIGAYAQEPCQLGANCEISDCFWHNMDFVTCNVAAEPEGARASAGAGRSSASAPPGRARACLHV